MGRGQGIYYHPAPYIHKQHKRLVVPVQTYLISKYVVRINKLLLEKTSSVSTANKNTITTWELKLMVWIIKDIYIKIDSLHQPYTLLLIINSLLTYPFRLSNSNNYKNISWVGNGILQYVDLMIWKPYYGMYTSFGKICLACAVRFFG